MARADKKLGISAPEWWKHLRPKNTRAFWKKVRKTIKEVLRGNQD